MEEAGEFQDWEMLQSTEMSHVSAPDLDEILSGSDEIDGGSEGVIRSDYFALGSEGQYGKKVAEQEEGSLGSDDLSEINPRSKPRSDVDVKRGVGLGGTEIAGGNSGVLGLDLGNDGSVARKFAVFKGKGELGYGVDVKREVGFEGIGDIDKVEEVDRESSSEFCLDAGGDDGKLKGYDRKRELGYGEDAKRGVSFEEIGIESKDSGEFVLDSDGEELISEKFEGVMGEDDLGGGDTSKTRDGSESGGIVEVGGRDGSDSVGFVEGGVEFSAGVENGAGTEVKSYEGEKRVVWWKLPLELLKFCVLRVTPVWSFSIAVSVVAFVILRRRLYKMRRKSRSIPLKVSVDDKKVSQIMIRVARLNEVFSVVKHVPIIRSSLPRTGRVTPWPVMGLR